MINGKDIRLEIINQGKYSFEKTKDGFRIVVKYDLTEEGLMDFKSGFEKQANMIKDMSTKYRESVVQIEEDKAAYSDKAIENLGKYIKEVESKEKDCLDNADKISKVLEVKE